MDRLSGQAEGLGHVRRGDGSRGFPHWGGGGRDRSRPRRGLRLIPIVEDRRGQIDREAFRGAVELVGEPGTGVRPRVNWVECRPRPARDGDCRRGLIEGRGEAIQLRAGAGHRVGQRPDSGRCQLGAVRTRRGGGSGRLVTRNGARGRRGPGEDARQRRERRGGSAVPRSARRSERRSHQPTRRLAPAPPSASAPAPR